MRIGGPVVAPEHASSIATRLQEVRDSITRAALCAGRDPSSITLVVVTKGVALDRVEEAVRAGAQAIGESRLQEALPKVEALSKRHPDLEWHYIGTLQRRKIKEIVGTFAMIQSVDSRAAAEEINRRAEAAGIAQRVLLEVNLAAEPTKHGLKPEELAGVVAMCEGLRGLAVEGLMAIPPYNEDPEKSRPYFRQLRSLAASVPSGRSRGASFPVLSMGMSHDFGIAVEEGATMVRVGQAIFGARDG